MFPDRWLCTEHVGAWFWSKGPSLYHQCCSLRVLAHGGGQKDRIQERSQKTLSKG